MSLFCSKCGKVLREQRMNWKASFIHYMFDWSKRGKSLCYQCWLKRR